MNTIIVDTQSSSSPDSFTRQLKGRQANQVQAAQSATAYRVSLISNQAKHRARTWRLRWCRLCLLAPLLALTPASTVAMEALLIGGGNDLQGSQGQIELNVKWVQGVLSEAGLPTSTWFTDGDQPEPDVHYHLPLTDEASALMPLARVFGDHHLEERRYREHTVEGVISGTHREILEPQLREIFTTKSDQDLLLVYNGHGSQSLSSPDRVTLNLWGDTRVTASEMHDWLRPHQAAFHFVFTQCYSGGFHRLAYADPGTGSELAEPTRCGFTAESAYRLAEGCSASIDTDDYRDYTTFFFAALAGRDRNELELARDPDADGDGRTTLREAHLYTLSEAWSTDLSRSTSEEWLDQWQPWYLRWLPTPSSIPDNDYGTMLRALAKRHDIPIEEHSHSAVFGQLTAILRNHLTAAEQQLQAQQNSYYRLEERIQQLQNELRYTILQLRPELMGPYTTAYIALAESGALMEIAKTLSSLPGYQTLVQEQLNRSELELALLETERQSTQIRKMIRLHRLSHLLEQLERHGSTQEKADYQALLDCEEVPLAP